MSLLDWVYDNDEYINRWDLGERGNSHPNKVLARAANGFLLIPVRVARENPDIKALTKLPLLRANTRVSPNFRTCTCIEVPLDSLEEVDADMASEAPVKIKPMFTPTAEYRTARSLYPNKSPLGAVLYHWLQNNKHNVTIWHKKGLAPKKYPKESVARISGNYLILPTFILKSLIMDRELYKQFDEHITMQLNPRGQTHNCRTISLDKLKMSLLPKKVEDLLENLQ